VLFHPNYFSSEAVDLLVAYNIELFHLHGGVEMHAGVYIDQVNEGVSSPYSGPCMNPGQKDFATAADGQLEYLKRLQHYFYGQLGLPMSGNPYRIRHYRTRHAMAPFDLYYNEKGDLSTNHVSDFGDIPADLVAVSLPASDQQNNDYLQALKTAGLAMQQGSWFGWFARAQPSRTINGVQLLRALPNWDNLANASSRSWDSNTLVYTTSNSYADPYVVYSRHPKTGKLFVVFHSPQGVVHLKSGEVVTDIKRVNELFMETSDGGADLTLSGSRLSLAKNDDLGKGYILTLAQAPNHIPTADAKGDQIVSVGSLVQLDGSGSTDADGDLLMYSWEIVTAPPGSVATLSATRIQQPSFIADQLGQYVVHLEVSDGKAVSAPAVLSITSIRPNSPPAALSQTLTTAANTELGIELSGSDADDDNLTYIIKTPPEHGVLSGTAPHLTYTPKSDFSGDDSFVFTTHDGQLESSAGMVSIHVLPPPAVPQNLLLNPSFEVLPAFTAWIPVTTEAVRASFTLGSGRDGGGSKSAEIKLSSAKRPSDVQLRQLVTLSPSGKYRLSFWAKAATDRTLVVALQQNVKHWRDVNLWQRVPITSSWRKVELKFTYTGSESNMRLVFRLGGKSGLVWFDDVELLHEK
jgi:hypothetical protein